MEKLTGYVDLVSASFTSPTPPRWEVTIPVHAREGETVREGIQSYLGSDLPVSGMHLSICVNRGTEADRMDTTEIAREVLHKNPGISFSLYKEKRDGLFRTISEVRLLLSLSALNRLRFLTDPQAFEHYLITHDADMIAVAPDYAAVCTNEFNNNAILGAGGLVNYHSTSLTVKLIQNIQDRQHQFDVIHRGAKPKFCGANSIIRSTAYSASGGHNPSFERKVNIPIRNALLKSDPQSIRTFTDAHITTSARRMEATLACGFEMSDPRKDFYKPGDSSEYYLGRREIDVPIDRASAAEKMQFLAGQLSAILLKQISLSASPLSRRFRRSGCRYNHEMITQKIYKDPRLMNLATEIADNLKQVCEETGVPIIVDGNFRVSIQHVAGKIARTLQTDNQVEIEIPGWGTYQLPIRFMPLGPNWFTVGEKVQCLQDPTLGPAIGSGRGGLIVKIINEKGTVVFDVSHYKKS